jgi:hypothetical protein
MNCERFQTVVNDLARGQLMESNERASALDHVAECDGCARNWESERSLSAGLRALAAEMQSLAAPPQVEENLLAAFRERSNAGLNVIPAVRVAQARRRLPRYWVAAIAALLLVVFGIVVARSGVLSRSKPQLAIEKTPKTKAPPNEQSKIIEASSPPTMAKEIEEPVHTPRSNPNYLATSHQSRASRGKYRNAASKTVTLVEDAGNIEGSSEIEGNSEVVTAFFPLGYESAPNLQDGGQLVRVELPRAAVARFGLPVNMDRTSERVKADVLVGSDGLAQAIRFVH